ncbi:MAG: hypothetical protein HRT57_02255 [Crocinitomicaceae bacterium]|nr:hypothetical protein [Crocinitomicaceae bacterium]
MKLYTILLALLISGSVSAQIGVSAGATMLNAFGNPKPYGGMHLTIEYPSSESVTFYGKLSHLFKQRHTDSSLISIIAYDFATTPYIKNIGGLSSLNYTFIEGGTKYYLGNGYDFGFAAYGGPNAFLAFNSVKMKYAEYDETLYALPEDYGRKASIVSFGVGFNGGVKYSIERIGTVYFDLGLQYIIRAYENNNMAYLEGWPRLSQLMFNFNLGFRRDILW